MKYFFVLSLLSFFYSTTAQSLKNTFKSPLKIPLILSGNFGELRNNHFHAGLDIKTQGRKGVKIYPAAEGFVSRIKISNHGYGKALYIQHPNGYTTVYAHLKEFAPKIEAYVKLKQYAKQSYEIELFPKKGEFPLSLNEVIAYSGNSGSSGGPHLHFEIRDAKQRPLNPMLCGIDIKDTRKPLVNTVWLYPLDDDAEINGYKKPYRLKTKSLSDGNLKTTPVSACGNIGIGLSTVDQQDGAYNKNGYYTISSSINGTKNFELEMNRFSFSETRYINRLIDYKYFKEHKSRITKLFIESNNPLSIYKQGNGYINIIDSLSYKCVVNIKDVKGNLRTISIPITGKSKPVKTSSITQSSSHIASPNTSFNFNNSFVKVSIPKGALYDYTSLDIKEVSENKIQIHKNTTPLHKYMTISFDLASVSDPKHSYIGEFFSNNPKKALFVGAKNNGTYLSARTRNFGNFGVFTDTTRPNISPLNFSNNKWISKLKTLRVSISDKESGIKNFRATINNKFALMEYDYKRNLLVYNFKDAIHTSGKNVLKIYVEDNVGNNTIFESIFFRK